MRASSARTVRVIRSGRVSSALARRLRPEGVVSLDEQGYTIVEMLIVVALMTVLFAMTIPVINVLFDTTAHVANTYVNANQLLPISTNLQSLLRSAVSPAPTLSGVPTPPFGVYTSPQSLPSPTSLTFFSNVGSSNGPAMITASCSPAPNGLCASQSSFTVTEILPIAGTCPTTTTSTSTCSYTGQPTKTLFNVSGLTNSADNAPLFVYSLLITTTTTTTVGQTSTSSTTATVGGSSNTPSGYATADAACSTPGTNGCLSTTPGFASCGAPNAAPANPPFSTILLGNCPAAEIQSITIDLQVNGNTSSRFAGEQEEDKSVVYLLSPVSSLFEPEVG